MVGAREHAHISSLLVQHGRQLERRLAAADDRHILACELRKIPVLGAVRYQFARQAVEHRRNSPERQISGRQDDASCPNDAAVRQSELKPVVRLTQIDQRCVRDFDACLLLKPSCVFQKIRNRQRIADGPIRHAARGVEALECIAMLRIRQVGRERLGFQDHARRHVVSPRSHRLPDDEAFDALGAQMRCDRQPVRAGTDDCVFNLHHDNTSLNCQIDGFMTACRRQRAGGVLRGRPQTAVASFSRPLCRPRWRSKRGWASGR